jgi:hypothetical protein
MSARKETCCIYGWIELRIGCQLAYDEGSGLPAAGGGAGGRPASVVYRRVDDGGTAGSRALLVVTVRHSCE